MAISTFGASVTSTEHSHEYLAQARDFKINFVSQNGDLNKGITPIEGLLAALGSCETIVTSSVYDKNNFAYNDFYLQLNLKDSIFHADFYLGDHADMFADVKRSIKETSPVYDNIVRAIPIKVSK
ncbi:hypothetical protein GCM10022297_07480 [Lactobacillus hamsteri]|uniref:OsmC family protein n=1 Tax=Lactobacillus hamsteri DSM 5661 = JCM 6256 TaxID=1423754 RepID=A0A0R1YE87_9LACO|nr:OsmC family protein [Lactobacillus hamsteri]KRM40559.1 hypothetical protein FC39_GL000584 [Lactobacillus hamsteri DSM 5661 = JCM 6256]